MNSRQPESHWIEYSPSNGLQPEFNVLQVIDTLNVGGAERVFVDLTNLLHESNVSISAMFLLSGGDLQKELNPKIETMEIKRKSKYGISAFLNVAKTIGRFHIVHCHSRHVYRYIKLIQRILCIKCKVLLHDHFGLIGTNKGVPFLLDGFLKPDFYIGVSQDLTEWASSQLAINKDMIFLLENIARRQVTPLPRHEGKEGVVLVSNIKPSKNQLFILGLQTELKISLTFIGGIQDIEYFRELKRQSKRFENQFLTNINNIQTHLKRYKLGLHTSLSETGPLVLIEYLAQGLPFLAYETGEVARILKPYFPQYFIDNFDQEKWTERISLLLQETPDTMKMEKVFNEHFGSGQYVEKCLNIYRSIGS